MSSAAFWFFAGEWLLKLAIGARLLLRRDLRDVTRLAWLVVVFAEPLIGFGLYFLIGERHMGRKRIQRYRRVALVQRRLDQGLSSQTPPESKHTAALVQKLGGRPALFGNRLELFSNSELFAERLVKDIAAAKLHCHLLFYIYLDDITGERVAAALADAVQRGVACRVLLDSIGSNAFFGSPLHERMRSAGIEVQEALPAGLLRTFFARIDLRNHRKVVVIDGAIAYSGSQNLAHSNFARKPRYGPWHDVMLRIHGPSAAHLCEVFLADWYLDSGQELAECLELEIAPFEDGASVQILPTGPDTPHTELSELNQFLIHQAKRRLVLTTPYFVPGPTDLLALRNAVRRGVHVQLIVPRRPDSILADLASRAQYGSLLEDGIEVHLFQPGLLHAKTMTLDGELAVITTANFDRRSFELNLETTSLVYDRDFAREVLAVQERYIKQSKPLTDAKYAHRPWHRRMLENAAGMMGPLL